MYCLIVINERMLIEYFQGERILKLAEMCRKLETEEEKVLPFYASSLTEQEQADDLAELGKCYAADWVWLAPDLNSEISAR